MKPVLKQIADAAAAAAEAVGAAAVTAAAEAAAAEDAGNIYFYFRFYYIGFVLGTYFIII
jgi:hypothetical protein